MWTGKKHCMCPLKITLILYIIPDVEIPEEEHNIPLPIAKETERIWEVMDVLTNITVVIISCSTA